MAADLSRIRSNPLLDFSGVELKQGGVVLDADFNELVAVTDRRFRAAASDILGRSTVSSTTPDAFKITLAAGDLQIGIGRLYVDGLLAECHGTMPDDPASILFDPLMAETVFRYPVRYGKQPYFPNPPALPTTGRHLVYLDVWEREVTQLQRPELVEVAVGIETSSRKQTVWQVRLHDAGASTCGTPDDVLAGWPDLIAPSGGRLTTGTFDMPPDPDPCELPPTGGYRGLENQTYRVEIHDPGPAGTATFKWSRENASVGTRVASIVSATELELHTLGRDDVLRFNTDDWVEILDDTRELSQGPGEIRKITVHEKTRRITFSPALPAGMAPGPFPNSAFPGKSNLRVCRWDQQHKILSAGIGGSTSVFQDLDVVGGAGAITVPPTGTTLLLERGLTVTFTSTGTKGFLTGDHWVFAARTADASVESLVSAPPRGVHHHYERLAIWNAATGDLTDCRHLWSRGCCTFVVFPGEDIQAAIDRLPVAGGCVCLKVGVHEIRRPLHIRRSNVTLHGETIGAVVRNLVDDEALRIGDRKTLLVNVRVEEIRFEVESARSPGAGAIQVVNLDGGAIRDCEIDSVPEGNAPVYTGIAVHDSRRVEVTGNAIRKAMFGVLGIDSEGMTIRENVVSSVPVEGTSVGMLGILLASGVPGVLTSVGPGRAGIGLNYVERNEIVDFATGIYIGARSGPTLVVSNAIIRQRVRVEDTYRPVLETSVTIASLNRIPRWWAVEVRTPGCTAAANRIPLDAPNLGGILFTAGETVVERNEIRSGVDERADLLPLGIVGLALRKHAEVEHCTIRGNTLHGLQGAITVAAEAGAAMTGVEIVENSISARFAAIDKLTLRVRNSLAEVFSTLADLGSTLVTQYGVWVDSVHRAVVLRNQIGPTVSGVLADGLTDGLIGSNQVSHCAHGLLLGGCERVEVSGNVLHDLVLWGALNTWGNANCFAENQVTRCSGYALFVVGGKEHRVSGGLVSDVGLGVLASATAPRVDDLTITDARHGGVVALLLPGEIGLSRNRLVRCGGAERASMAAAILVLGAVGHIEIDACTIRDTGGLDFPGPRFDVLVYLGQSARLHACSISGQPSRAPHQMSHAILAITRPWTAAPSFADLLDNDVSVSGDTIVDCLAFFKGESMCAGNRVVNRRLAAPTTPTLRILGQVVTATGNRVNANGTAPSIRIFAANTSAVGNSSSNGAILGGALKPTPYATFNAST